MTPDARRVAKRALASLPWTAEAYQGLWGSDRPAVAGYGLERLAAAVPAWAEAARQARAVDGRAAGGRRILLMGSLPWWLEYATALGLLLAADGHHVDLAFLPYRTWTQPVEPFDGRRQAAYIRHVLSGARPLLGLFDLADDVRLALPPDLVESIEEQSRIDTQYTRQRETIEVEGEDRDLYRLRMKRNLVAGRAALRILRSQRYAAVVIPNGSILEFGAVYRVARSLRVPTVTFEFGEQRERMWLARDQEVMRQDTSPLWQVRSGHPLSDGEREALERMLQARRGGRPWANFGRQWQAAPGQGAERTRDVLGLHPDRPVALLCTNVVGDSLALGRQVFTKGMTDWLACAVRHFADRPDVQLIVRVHPGELLGAGHPSVEIVRSELPHLPPHVVVIPPESKVNTYDLIELARVGLVYTTTVGLEMAMAGLPVIVAGQTHYRGKGFTIDPASADEFTAAIDRALAAPPDPALVDDRVRLACAYAYRFFFEYPFAFPWHLIGFWDDVAARPFESVVTASGREAYRRTLSVLSGDPIDWRATPSVMPV